MFNQLRKVCYTIVDRAVAVRCSSYLEIKGINKGATSTGEPLFDGLYSISGQSEQKEPVLTKSTIHLTHTNVGTRFRGGRQGLVAALATAGAKSVATPPREFLLTTAGETGSERSKFGTGRARAHRWDL